MESSASVSTINVPREGMERSAVGSAGVMRLSMGSLKLSLQKERRVTVNLHRINVSTQILMMVSERGAAGTKRK